MRRALIALLLPACSTPAEEAAPCPSFAETAIVDELGDPDAVENVERALADFASWTTRAGACVSEIVVTADVPDGTGGVYSDGRIRIEPDGAGFSGAYGTTIHELCHAWDDAEGFPSQWHRELFPADSVEVSAHYYDEDLRTAEAFARVCDSATDPVAEDQLVADLCDDPPALSLGEAWVRAHVFDAFVDPLPFEAARAPMAVTGAPLWEGEIDWAVVSAVAGDQLVLLRGRYDETGAFVARVLLVDPATAAVTAELPLPEQVDSGLIGLLPTDGDPVVWAGLPLRAWRLDPDTGAATSLPIPDPPDSRATHGYVHGDSAWLAPYDAEPFTLDLATGATGALPWPEGATPSGEVRMYGNGDRVSVHSEGRVDTWSFATSTWSTLELPDRADSPVAPLADGRVVTQYRVLRGEGYRVVPVAVDPAAPVWTFPDEACDTVGWDDYAGLLPVGNVVYFVDVDGGAAELVRIAP